MKFSAKITPVVVVGSYTCSGQNGPYTIDTWKFKGLDGKEFVASVFGDNSTYLSSNSQEIDAEFEITSREWNGKWFNDVKLVKLDKEEVAPATTPVNNNASSSPVGGMPEGSDLPF